MLSRLAVALALSAAVVSGAAIAFLRTDFAAQNLCAYAVATIEEATAAQVRVARCSVEPAKGQLVIDGLEVGAPGGRLQLEVARVFVKVVLRPLAQRVRLERLEIDHPRLRLALDEGGRAPAARGRECLPAALERFELGRVNVRKASVEVRSAGVGVYLPRASLAVHGDGDRLRLAISTRGGAVDLPGRRVGIESTETRAAVDLRAAGRIDLERAELATAEASLALSGTLKDLCAPQIEATGKLRIADLARAADRFLPGHLRGVAGSLATDASFVLAGGKPRLEGELRLRGVRLEGFSPGDVNARYDWMPSRLDLRRFDVAFAGGGEVSGRAQIALAERLPLMADLSLRDMELTDLLRKLGLPHAWVVLRASGSASVKGALAPFSLDGDVAFDLADFAVLDRAYDSRARRQGSQERPQRVLEFARGRLATRVSADKDKIELHNALIEVAGSRLSVEGTLFTDGKVGMDLRARSEALGLEDLRGHLAAIPWGGQTALDARVHGPYGDLRIEGNATVRDFRFYDLSLGDVSAEAAYAGEALRFTGIRGRKRDSTFSGRIALDFKPREEGFIEAHVDLPKGRIHDLVDMGVGILPAFRAVADVEDLDGGISASLEVKGPMAAPDGEASIRLAGVGIFGERFPEGDAHLTLRGSEELLQIDRLELRRERASARLAGRLGPAWQLAMDAQTEGMNLADVDPLAKARLSGPLSAWARIRGAADHPLVDAEARFVDGRAGKAELGEGALAIRIDADDLTWHGSVGTHSFEGRATLAGDRPYRMKLALRFDDLSGYFETFLPDADLRGGSARAEVALRGSLLRPRQSQGSVALTDLKLVRNETTFENDGPGQLAFGPSGIEVQRVAFRAPYTTATLAGTAGRGGLELRLAASIDGRIVQGLFAEVEHAAGTILLQSAVGGTLQAPTVLGNLRVEDFELRLRGLPVAARELKGSVSFSQDALVIDELTGKLNGGDARVSGGLELQKLAPRKVDLAAHVTDVNVNLEATLGGTVDGDLTLQGPPLEPVLGGSLLLNRVKYTEKIDLERSLLDFSRRPLAPRAMAKSALLVHVDLDVHLGRGVSIENNLARAELKGDLKVTGTSRNLGLLGSVNTLHGTAHFRGNEFQIEQGVLTFTDRQRVRPSFDLQAMTQVKEYKVRLHAFGTPGEPHVTLVSEPALAEADLGFLLTFGFLSANLQQANFNATDSGLAIGVEALNKVTGFSDEVRRFIPKNTILRDPNLDFASDFSVATSRLEPMARFRSHLLSEKVDLRVLEGLSTRRYRGVLSYQLSDSLSGQLQLDNEHLTQGTDFGLDLKFKWEGD